MSALARRLRACGHRAGLEPVDLWFLGLRAATSLAGLVWWWLAPPGQAPGLLVIAGFLAFSTALYGWNAVRPGRLADWYRVALVFDLGLVYVSVRTTGGFTSDLYLAFMLLIALHAFYFGLRTGLAAAASASALYAAAGDWPPPLPAFGLRVAFFWLVGVCMGVLAEQGRRREQALEGQREHLLRSDRLATVGELAAGLAHELRNPLAGISGALHVLADRLAPSDECRDLLADLQHEIGRMNRTLTDLLQHARPVRPERVTAEVHGVLEQVLQFLARADIQIVRRFDPGLPAVQADPGLLHQALLNILINARQAMPTGGCLTIETSAGDGGAARVEIRISDTGSGIPPDHLPRIFQPFFTTKSQGTGLGLAIAARIVEQHGGRIDVESRLGRGTTFTITLPVGGPPERARSEAYAL